MIAIRRLVLMVLAAVPASAQITPNTRLDPLPKGTASIEIELSRFEAGGYRGRETSLHIPGKLDFSTAVVRIAYAPSTRFALGAEVPYRIVEYRPDLGTGAQRNRGIAGASLFAEMAHHPFRMDAVFRAGYLRAAGEDDPVLSVSDGVDRLSLTYAVMPARKAGRFVGQARAGIVLGPARAPEEDGYGAAWLQLAAGRTLVRGFDLLLLAGLGMATAAREEGTFFSNQKSRNTTAGVMMQWQARTTMRLRVSATHTLSVTEHLEGLRVTLSACHSLDRPAQRR